MGSGRQSCEPEFNYTGYEPSRPEMERWTGIPKAAGTAVRIFRETHAISAMASSTTGYDEKRPEMAHKSLQYLSLFASINYVK